MPASLTSSAVEMNYYATNSEIAIVHANLSQHIPSSDKMHTECSHHEWIGKPYSLDSCAGP